MNKKLIISDIILNILASTIPMFILQFIFLPLIASKINVETYGKLLTIVGLMNLSAATLGNILNNSKLINYKKYEELELKGDFSILLLIFSLINIISLALGLWYYDSFNLINVILIISASTFLLLKGYGTVEFRMKLNFAYILMDSVFLSLGYGIGYLIFLIVGYWQYLYLMGFLTSFLYVFSKTTIFKEPLKRTDLFNVTTSETLWLLFSGILAGSATYIDRLMLYPLLGAEAVAVYYTATILGKTIFLIIQPISGVFLSYLAQLTKIDNKNFHTIFISSLITGGLGYILTIIISKPILTLLYPQYVDAALKYIYVTTLTTIILIISSIINPIILRFYDMKWQMVINGAHLSIYILLSLSLMYFFGLMGFCIGILIASIIKLVVMLLVYNYINIRSNLIEAKFK